MRAALILAALLPLTLAGCAGDSMDGDHISPQSELDTVNGLYHLELEPSPNPPTAGDASLRLTVTDKADDTPVADTPVADATVGMDLMMPEHDHGMATPPAVTNLGSGVYLASWSYPMTGYWELTITVEGAAGKDEAVVGYEVE